MKVDFDGCHMVSDVDNIHSMFQLLDVSKTVMFKLGVSCLPSVGRKLNLTSVAP